MQDITDWLIQNATLLTAIATVIGLIGVALKGLQAILNRINGPSRHGTDAGERPEGVDELAWATRMLARSTKEQWQKEAIRLGLLAKTGPGTSSVLAASLIRIGWSVDATRMPIHPGQAADDLLAPWRDSAGVDQLADFFSASPAKAMVIVGSPQAGKTAASVLMTLRLLDRRVGDTDPVPVKFSLAHWDRDVTLEAWLEDRLLDDHAGFRNTETYGRNVVKRLLRGGLVLPILDGLDELPGVGDGEEDERDRVVEAINSSELPLPGLILTCQAEVYDGLPHRLREATIVELAGVPPTEAERYIKNSALETSHPERWEPLLKVLRSGRSSAVASALTSPLMVFLLPRVYRDVNSTPGELLGKAFVDPWQVEQHLLSAFVPSVFPDRPGEAGWRSRDARRWLGHLAWRIESGAEASEPSAGRFGWWDLSRYGRPQTAIGAGVVGGLTGGTAVGLACTALFNPLAGLVLGTVAAVSLGYLCFRNPPPKPSETQTRRDLRGRSILKSGAAIGAIVFIGGVLSRDVSLGLIAGIGFGVPIAFLYGLTEPDPTLRPLDAGLLLRRDLNVGGTFGFTYGLPAAITAWFLSGDAVLSAAVGLFAGLAGALLYGPIWAFAALAPGSEGRRRLDAVGVVAFVHLGIAIARFAPMGLLPWRPMAFLDRAHELGVLRLVSGSYEFRHRALQKVLAAEYETASGLAKRVADRPIANTIEGR